MAAHKAESKNADVRAALDELDRRVSDLGARRSLLHAERLKLEAAGVKPVEPRPPINGAADAEQMLETGNVVALVRTTDATRLWDIIREISVIDAANELAGKRAFRLRVENKVELLGDISSLWKANISKTAKAVLLLRELADEREALRQEYIARSGLQFELPCGPAADHVVGRYVVSDPAQAFLESARNNKMI